MMINIVIAIITMEVIIVLMTMLVGPIEVIHNLGMYPDPIKTDQSAVYHKITQMDIKTKIIEKHSIP